MTTNHNYNKPRKGAVNWDEPLNDNFDSLDTDVEVRDVESSLDDYSPKSGAKFFAVDTGGVFIGDGSTWNFVGEVGASSSGSGDGTAPQAADWVVSSDAEMQEAANNARDGDFIYVSSGFEGGGYRFEDLIELTIMGQHWRNTQIDSRDQTIFEFDHCHHTRLSRLHLNGRHVNPEPLVAFRASSPHYSQYIHDCRFGESLGDGVLWETIHDSTIHRCEFFALGDASQDTYNLRIEGGRSFARGNQIADCRFERNATTSTPAGLLYMSNLQQSAIRGCKFHEGRTESPVGMLVSGGGNQRTHLVGDYFFADLRSDLVNWNDNDKGVISSCLFYGDADTGLITGDNKTVSSCLFDGGMNRAIDAGSRNLIIGNQITASSEAIRTTGADNLVAINSTAQGGGSINLSSGTINGLNI